VQTSDARASPVSPFYSILLGYYCTLAVASGLKSRFATAPYRHYDQVVGGFEATWARGLMDENSKGRLRRLIEQYGERKAQERAAHDADQQRFMSAARSPRPANDSHSAEKLEVVFRTLQSVADQLRTAEHHASVNDNLEMTVPNWATVYLHFRPLNGISASVEFVYRPPNIEVVFRGTGKKTPTGADTARACDSVTREWVEKVALDFAAAVFDAS
jgi:hypothetical protein